MRAFNEKAGPTAKCQPRKGPLRPWFCPLVEGTANSLFSPRFSGQDLLLLFLVVFVNLVYTLNFLHAVGELPGLLGHATPGHLPLFIVVSLL